MMSSVDVLPIIHMFVGRRKWRRDGDLFILFTFESFDFDFLIFFDIFIFLIF